MNVTVPLKDTKDDGFPRSTASSFTFNAACSKKRFVDFNLPTEGRLGITKFNETLPNRFQISVDGVAI